MDRPIRIGYWAAHEQYPSDRLLDFVVAAEEGGFETVLTSDHFMPWFDSGAHCGFAWAWMAACAGRTKRIQIGTGVTAPDRYHPGLIAQAFATLDEIFPGRFILGLGAGEAMNCIPLGIVWPEAGQRARRLKEALEIIRSLWSGETTSYPGFFYRLDNARLYTVPKTQIPIFVAAGGRHTARIAGQYADGIIGFSGEKQGGGGEDDDVFRAAQEAASENGRDPHSLERLIEFKCSYAEDYDSAMNSAKIWRSTMVEGVLDSDIADPVQLERKGREDVADQEVEDAWMIVTDVEELIKPIDDIIGRGYTMVQVHSSSPDEMKFIEEFTTRALPALNEKYHKPAPLTAVREPPAPVVGKRDR